MYEKSGLLEGVQNCKRNIKVLEKAIEDERNTIKEYRVMIEDIDRAEAKMAEAKAGVHIEVVNDDQD